MKRPTAIGLAGISIGLTLTCGLSVALSNEVSNKRPPVLWTAPADAARKPNPLAGDASAISAGQKLYLKECVACPGRTGKGDGRTASQLKVRPGDLSSPKMRQQTDGELFWKISQGKTPMPSYQKGYSEKERWMVVNYIRTLAPQGFISPEILREQNHC